MPKKGAKGGKDAKGKGKAKEEPPDVSVQMKRVRQEMAKVCAELSVPPEAELDKMLNAKFNETLLAQSQNFVFQGDRPDSTTLGVKVFTAALKELCPQFVPTKTLCFWRSQLGEEGVAAVCEHLLSKKKARRSRPTEVSSTSSSLTAGWGRASAGSSPSPCTTTCRSRRCCSTTTTLGTRG